MAEGTIAAGQPAHAAPQPAQPSTPSQSPSISPDDYARLTRVEQQFKGSQPLLQAATRYGLKSPQDIEAWGPAISTLREQGINPQQLAQAFGKQAAELAEDKGVDASQLSHRDIERMMGERMSKFEADLIRKQAEREHDQAMNSEYAELESDSFYGDALGELKDSKEGRELLKYAAIGRHLSGAERKEYEEGHPLKGRYGPAGKEGLGSIKNWLGQSMKGIVTGLRASQAAGIGKAARESVEAGTVAGGAANQGAPLDQRKPGQLPSRAEIQAALEAREAKRANR